MPASLNPFEIDTVTQEFKIVYSEDETLAGTYNVMVEISLVEYTEASTVVTTTHFVVTIIDPCQTAITITASTVPTTVDYTISQPV